MTALTGCRGKHAEEDCQPKAPRSQIERENSAHPTFVEGRATANHRYGACLRAILVRVVPQIRVPFSYPQNVRCRNVIYNPKGPIILGITQIRSHETTSRILVSWGPLGSPGLRHLLAWLCPSSFFYEAEPRNKEEGRISSGS